MDITTGPAGTGRVTAGGRAARSPSVGITDPPAGLATLSTLSSSRLGTISFTVRSPVARADVPGLCDRVGALLRQGRARVAYCELRGAPADAVAVDALARLQLAARRNGCEIRVCHASRELRELIALMGLADVLAE